MRAEPAQVAGPARSVGIDPGPHILPAK